MSTTINVALEKEVYDQIKKIKLQLKASQNNDAITMSDAIQSLLPKSAEV